MRAKPPSHPPRRSCRRRSPRAHVGAVFDRVDATLPDRCRAASSQLVQRRSRDSPHRRALAPPAGAIQRSQRRNRSPCSFRSFRLLPFFRWGWVRNRATIRCPWAGVREGARRAHRVESPRRSQGVSFSTKLSKRSHRGGESVQHGSGRREDPDHGLSRHALGQRFARVAMLERVRANALRELAKRSGVLHRHADLEHPHDSFGTLQRIEDIPHAVENPTNRSG